MARSVTLVAHVEADELKARYRRAADLVERSHLHAVWLLACGHTQAKVAAVTGYSTRQIRAITRRYNAGGPNALGDRRRLNAGAKPRLDAADQAELTVVLAQPPPDGGPWTGRKVAAWIALRMGRERVPAQLGWAYLKRVGQARHAARLPAGG